MLKNLHKVIILGAAWGIFEATVGYFLHMFTKGVGWLVWFPIALFFINKSYAWTKSFSCVMLTAFIASSLKLVNLFFPVRVDMVINPAVSIILEALSVVLVYHYIQKDERRKVHIVDILLIGFVWRTLYLSYVFFLPRHLLEISHATNALSFTRFMFFENVVNTVFIYAGILLAQRLKGLRFDSVFIRIDSAVGRHRLLKPALSVFSLALAVTIKIITV